VPSIALLLLSFSARSRGVCRGCDELDLARGRDLAALDLETFTRPFFVDPD
jgi:hypothetical protein